MLLLSKLRLVNWHFFQDTTISMGQMTLLAGDNATGKSTIIDAIQYALVANIRKIRFNSAATDSRSGRSLESYCRCKVGADLLDYARGDTISHVILEFSGTGRDASFCAGIMVECYRENRDTAEHCYVLKKGRIEDITIFDGTRFLPPGEFKQGLKTIGGELCATKKDYNSRLTHLLGVHRRNLDFNPYLETVVRSVNFKPFLSVDRFVCDYILDERQVDISAMKENLNNYKEAEKEAIRIQSRIESLEKIEQAYDEIIDAKRQMSLQEMLLYKINLDICSGDIAAQLSRQERIERDLKHGAEREATVRDEIQGRENLIADLKNALSANDTYALWERMLREKESLERSIEADRKEVDRAGLLRRQVESLLGRKIAADLGAEIESCESAREDRVNKRVRAELGAASLEKSIAEKKDELGELSKGILRLPENIMTERLLDALRKKGVDATVFCDLLEITDETWQNAVEGWLNTQRFNILVGESDFQKALEIYNSLPRDVYGVGLPDLGKMRDSEISPGSLAETVVPASPLSRRYLAAVLGEVMMAKIDTIRNHRKAVTKDCMRYSGHTASRISPDIYSRWYIGKKAKLRRKESLTAELAALEESLAREKSVYSENSEALDILKRAVEALYELKNLSLAERRIEIRRGELAALVAALESIDKKQFTEIESQIYSISAILKPLREELETLIGKQGAFKSQIGETRNRILEKSEEEKILRSVFEEYALQNAAITAGFDEYYRERTRTGTLPEIRENYLRNRKGNETKLSNMEKALYDLKNDFNRENNLIMSADFGDSGRFIELLEKYRNTELPAYREKISRAREDAERQFKEHFVTRLNEYIEDARQSFAEINHTLKSIRFGKDQYRFTIEEKPEKRRTLDVISTAARISDDSGTLWEQMTSPEDRETVERLFKSILEHEIDSAEVRELCDYREYFHYDIRITHTDMIDEKSGSANVSSLSRVLREKSGGETQTPYYVAIAASFFRFFKENDSAARLVLFDEAFNKMDDDRIGKTIDFFRKIGIQIVTAVPTEKIEPVAPFMDRTNIVIRHRNMAFVREYGIVRNGKADG